MWGAIQKDRDRVDFFILVLWLRLAQMAAQQNRMVVAAAMRGAARIAREEVAALFPQRQR